MFPWEGGHWLSDTAALSTPASSPPELPPSSGIADRTRVSCAAQLLQDLMPDALHPNAAGMRLLAECILPFLKLYAPVEKHAGLPDMPH